MLHVSHHVCHINLISLSVRELWTHGTGLWYRRQLGHQWLLPVCLHGTFWSRMLWPVSLFSTTFRCSKKYSACWMCSDKTVIFSTVDLNLWTIQTGVRSSENLMTLALVLQWWEPIINYLVSGDGAVSDQPQANHGNPTTILYFEWVS